MKFKQILSFIFIFVFIFSSFSISTFAAGIGACTHTSHGNSIDKTIESAQYTSLTWMRDELLWGDVEKTKGELKLPFNASWIDKANEQGIKPLVILAFGNPIYEAGKVSQEDIDKGAFSNCAIPVRDGQNETTLDDEYFDAFIRYVDFISKEMAGKVGVYEIWNEPDIKAFNAKDATAKDYTQLLKEAYSIIKKNDPNVKIAGGALAYSGDFLEEMLKAGAGEYMDILSIHYYLSKSAPEKNARERLDEKRKILKRLGYDNMPIWVTETGWANSDVDELTQAKYIVRNAALYEDFLLDNHIQGQYISYELHDSNVTNEQLGGAAYESSLGLVRYDYTPKISAKAVSIYNKLTADKKLEYLDETGYGLFWSKTAYTAKFTNSENKRVYIVWSETPKEVEINLPVGESIIYDLQGNILETTTQGGIKKIQATDEPIYIEIVTDNPIDEPTGFCEKLGAFFKKIIDVIKNAFYDL